MVPLACRCSADRRVGVGTSIGLLIGFDVFGSFPPATDPDDARFVEQFAGAAGPGITEQELAGVLAHKTFANVELVAGDILETVPRYVAEHPELKIALCLSLPGGRFEVPANEADFGRRFPAAVT
jgi:hypothetical protein